MNPQQNETRQDTGGQQQAPDSNVQNYDGLNGPNIAYENYDDKAMQQQQQAQQQEVSAIPMNVVDVVNANGVVSGRKVVDYIWQRGAICLAVLAVGLLIGLVFSLIIVVNLDKEMALTKRELDNKKSELNGLFVKLGVTNSGDAISQIDAVEMLDGGDLSEIDALLTEKFGANYTLDLADTNINFVQRNGVYKIASLGVHRASGTKRVVLYEKIAEAKWKFGGFDATKDDPCADSTGEEKEAIKNVIPCKTEEDEEE